MLSKELEERWQAHQRLATEEKSQSRQTSVPSASLAARDDSGIGNAQEKTARAA